MCIRCNKPLSGLQRMYCSKKCCQIGAVSKRRKKIKLMAVEYMGGKCIDCGYSRCVAALHFHHPDGNKEFGIAAGGNTRSWDRVKIELNKCVLVCANCHAERHWRVV